MEPTTLMLILTIAGGLLSLAATFLSYYYSIKESIRNAAESAINSVENLDKIGEEKMAIAVEQVYGLIPAVAKPFFSKSTIQVMIQLVFDQMEEYAKKQVNK